MTAPAAPLSDAVTCTECGIVIGVGSLVVCVPCHESGNNEAFDSGHEAAEDEQVAAPQLIREWAQRRFLMGQISRQAKEELGLCADDIEVGHG